MKPVRLAAALAFLSLLSACGDTARGFAAREPSDDAACVLDGMVLKDFAGPKAQILYKEGAPDDFCNLVEVFSVLLAPESKRAIGAVFVQDMGQADWDHPRGHWIDARTAFYVGGSRKQGSMGPTFGSFATRAAAETFAAREGGRVLAYADITQAMLDAMH